jgi:hypothetical protein
LGILFSSILGIYPNHCNLCSLIVHVYIYITFCLNCNTNTKVRQTGKTNVNSP